MGWLLRENSHIALTFSKYEYRTQNVKKNATYGASPEVYRVRNLCFLKPSGSNTG